jgi:multiple antibiotic resistance protein
MRRKGGFMTFLETVNYFIALLVICNPLGALPALLRLTEYETPEQRKRTAFVAAVAVLCILVVVTWIGSYLLVIFGIKVPPFQFGGGFVVFLLSLSMLRAEQSRIKQTKEEQIEASIKESVAITPLAMPLIAGPGAISTVIVNASLFPSFLDQLYMTFSAVLVAFIMGIVMYFATYFEKLFGRVGINIFTRIGGLILAANSVESMAKGLIGMFPVLSTAIQ